MKLTQEIFAVGNWNGFPFTLNDLRKMAASFTSLANVLKVPLKLGHNEEQEVTDGQPALGWVTGMSVVDNKLVAEFDDVPDIVHNAMTKKLYRSVSIELDFDVEHKGTAYDFVVTAVALLGADMPAVNVLNDLANYMSRNSKLAQSGYSAGRHTSFKTITGNIEEPNMNELEKALAKVAQLEAEKTVATAKFTALETTSAANTAKFEAEKLQFETDQKKVKSDAARSTFTTILEDAVKAKSITPAQRESFAKVLRIDDDDAVLLLKEEDVTSLFSTHKSKGEDTAHKEGEDITAQATLVQKTNELMASSGEKQFDVALFTVMRANPKLAAEYIDSNGEVEQ